MTETKPDKRVPAELWEHLLWYHGGPKASTGKRIAACPDIVDEPATLDPTAQAVLDAVGRRLHDSPSLNKALSDWVLAGRPTTAPAVLHKTAQAVLVQARALVEVERLLRKRPNHKSELTHKRDTEMDRLFLLLGVWDDAGRPGVVGAGEDPTLAKKLDEASAKLRDVNERILTREIQLRQRDEDAATLAALNECRELGLEHSYTEQVWRVRSPDTRRNPGEYAGDTLPEALAAYKAAQAPEVEDPEAIAKGLNRDQVRVLLLTEVVYHCDGPFRRKVDMPERLGSWRTRNERHYFAATALGRRVAGVLSAWDGGDRLPDRPEGDE